MNTFKLENRFNPRTGEPTTPELQEDFPVYCDYSGTLLPLDEPLMHEYQFLDTGGSEESWYYDHIVHEGKRIDVRHLMTIQPHFAYSPLIVSKKKKDFVYNPETLMMVEWTVCKGLGSPKQLKEMKSILKELDLPVEPEFINCTTIADVMCLSRRRAIVKLLAQGIPMSTLGLKYEDVE